MDYHQLATSLGTKMFFRTNSRHCRECGGQIGWAERHRKGCSQHQELICVCGKYHSQGMHHRRRQNITRDSYKYVSYIPRKPDGHCSGWDCACTEFRAAAGVEVGE